MYRSEWVCCLHSSWMRTTNRRPPDGRTVSLEHHFFPCLYKFRYRRFSFQVIARRDEKIKIICSIQCSFEKTNEVVFQFQFDNSNNTTVDYLQLNCGAKDKFRLCVALFLHLAMRQCTPSALKYIGLLCFVEKLTVAANSQISNPKIFS